MLIAMDHGNKQILSIQIYNPKDSGKSQSSSRRKKIIRIILLTIISEQNTENLLMLEESERYLYFAGAILPYFG